MKKRKILGITATTENRVLEYATSLWCSKFRHFANCETEIVDLAALDGGRKLQTFLESGEIDFCFSMQGVGSRLVTGEKKSVWSHFKTPFLCLHADHPSCNIFNHFCDSPYVANLYLFESFLDIQKRYIRNNQLNVHIPYETGLMTHAQKPFHERTYGLVFMKGGKNPGLYADQLNQVKPPLREAIWAGIESLRQDENLDICDLLAGAFKSCHYDHEGFWREFWGFTSLIENYIRAQRATTLVDWLKYQKTAVIIGDGWDFINKEGTHAQFHSNVDAVEGARIYTNTKFTFNTSPYGRDIIHERITHGLSNNNIVVSDTNVWWDNNFADVSNLFRYYWNKDLESQLGHTINDCLLAERIDLNSGYNRLEEKLFYNNQIPTIAEYGDKVREFVEKQMAS